jgi:UDP-N-acetylmuramyl pentapeptide phosphotransferase/UDP-N-acetylglucosamine-1-phosphate transferase
MINLIIFCGVFLLSWLAVGWFRHWSIRQDLLDVPNERSSHESPKPVGAGIVIVVLFLFSIVLFGLLRGTGFRLWPYVLGAALIAVVSWFDDMKPVPALIRFAVHIFSAVIVVTQMPGLGYSYEFPLGLAVRIVAVVWIVWMTNAYNFMDGIDGLAGIQAVVASVGWAILGFYLGFESLQVFSIVLLGASLGFLIHNWPPATVFMGDVGSAFLGFTFAVMPLIAVTEANSTSKKYILPIATIAFVWFFVADTVLTFFRRLISGDHVWKAHRKHFYQLLIKNGSSHLRVSVFYGCLMTLAASSLLVELYYQIPYLALGICGLLSLIWLALVVKVVNLTDQIGV